jgi:hypothetical protein
MSRAAPDPHPHPLTPDDLPAGTDWWHSCPLCHQPIQGGPAGLAAHRRTVHHHRDDPRIPITINLDL